MKTYVALFRGINVGGSHPLPMKALRLTLEKSGCSDVRTYIQSGNAVFRSSVADAARVAEQLTAAVSKSHGFEPRVLVLTRGELESAALANPFPEAGDESDEPSSLFSGWATEAGGSEIHRGAQSGKRALHAEGQDLLPSRSRRVRKIQAGGARRTAARGRGHRSQLEDGHHARRDGKGLGS